MLLKVGRFSQTIGRRLRKASGRDAFTAGEQMIALADGRKFWATKVSREEWADLKPGHELLLVQTRHQHKPYPYCIELATVEGNNAQFGVLVLAWGWWAPGEADDRPATALYYRDLATILRYELRETGCPDVVSTIIPTPN